MSFDVAVGDRWWHGRAVYAQMTRPACAEPLRLECLLYVRCPVAHLRVVPLDVMACHEG